jgi:hypothetical protein
MSPKNMLFRKSTLMAFCIYNKATIEIDVTLAGWSDNRGRYKNCNPAGIRLLELFYPNI